MSDASIVKGFVDFVKLFVYTVAVADETTKAPALIGALLAIPHYELQRRVQSGFAKAGLPEIRPAHNPIFQWLPAEGARVTEIAERIGTTKQAVGYLVDYLEANGYLERVPDPRDGRALLVKRTKKGWRVNQTARKLVEEVQTDWAGRIGEDQMARLRDLLGDLVRALAVDYSPRLGGIPEDQPPRPGGDRFRRARRPLLRRSDSFK
ncbi:MAG TPA: MarR family transcriptional regulator [Candidatus Dormibacteraeota bacterium]|nr:MarR family transcriptional regulator [Candidatus Dormibacteraeota bacterium]